MTSALSVYEIAWYFLIYSCLGWIVEVIYQAVAKGKIVNRGFLNGPVCPVYGAGVLSILLLLSALGGQGAEDANPLLLFLFGMVITTAIELVAGWLLDRIFHARWWDYSEKPFNFHGYICLEFSIIWGLSVLFVLKLLHPFVRHTSVGLIPERYGWTLLGILYLAWLADLIVTVAMLHGLNRKLAELDELQRRMRLLSDGMSERIGGNALHAAQHVQEATVQAHLGRAEWRESVEERRVRVMEKRQELQSRIEQLYDSMYRYRHVGTGRFLLAFPSMRHSRYREAAEELKRCLNRRRDGGK